MKKSINNQELDKKKIEAYDLSQKINNILIEVRRLQQQLVQLESNIVKLEQNNG